MPLDASIFLQGAALRAQNNAQLQNVLGDVVNQYKDQKRFEEEQKNKGFDLEKLAQGYQLKQNMGIEGTPEEKAAFDTFLQFQSSERAVDPVTGNLYPKFQWSGPKSGFNLGALGPQGQGSNPAINTPYDQITPVPMNFAQVEQFTQDQPAEGGIVPGAPGLNMEVLRPKINVPEELEGNPNAKQKYLESVASKQGEKDIEEGGRSESIDTIISSLESLSGKMPEAPSGVVQSGAAWVGNKLGHPNPQSVAQADIEGRLPIILGQVKNFVRSKGEGTFSDRDQKLLEKMLPVDSDSTAVKMSKLNAVANEFRRIKGLSPKGTITPQTQQEFDALPSGTIYIDPDDGKKYRKP